MKVPKFANLCFKCRSDRKPNLGYKDKIEEVGSRSSFLRHNSKRMLESETPHFPQFIRDGNNLKVKKDKGRIKDENIGFNDGTWILRIYRIYHRYMVDIFT